MCALLARTLAGCGKTSFLKSIRLHWVKAAADSQPLWNGRVKYLFALRCAFGGTVGDRVTGIPDHHGN